MKKKIWKWVKNKKFPITKPQKPKERNFFLFIGFLKSGAK